MRRVLASFCFIHLYAYLFPRNSEKLFFLIENHALCHSDQCLIFQTLKYTNNQKLETEKNQNNDDDFAKKATTNKYIYTHTEIGECKSNQASSFI